jgi:hypothetical protein
MGEVENSMTREDNHDNPEGRLNPATATPVTAQTSESFTSACVELPIAANRT